MTPETPAQGILKTHDWGNSKWYLVFCDCGSDDHALRFEVEADDTGVTVTTYTTQKTNYWEEPVQVRYDIERTWMQELHLFWTGLVNGLWRKVSMTWQIWIRGYVQYESVTAMNEQVALNYAHVLQTAINDVKSFREQRREKSK